MLCRIKSAKGFYLGHGNNNVMHQVHFKEAGVWEQDKAEKVIKNLPGHLRMFGPYEIELVNDDTASSNVRIPKPIEEGEVIQMPATIESCNMSEDTLKELGCLVDAMEHLSNVSDKLTELEAELTKLDNKRLDLLHIIELEPAKNLNQAYNLYKDLRETSIERRKVKDLIMIYTAWRDAFKTSNSSSVIVASVANALTERRYYFRSTDTND